MSTGEVLERLCVLGSVASRSTLTARSARPRDRAEGTAVGFNKKKKGARSYYPLFCTVAQTGQVLDLLHRPGNVHDSNGAEAFILQCVEMVRHRLSWRDHLGWRKGEKTKSAFFF